VLGKVSFAVVNTDRQSSIARKLMRGGSIPQLIVFHKTDDGWKRRQMTGVQSVSDIESAVNSALKDVELKLTHASQDQKMN
jgi:thioredoxin-like negative regulator of GroEL